MTIFLQSELTTNNSGFIEKNRYEILFSVELFRENKEDSIFYDKEQKIYYESSSALTNTYEVELKKIILKLSNRLEKAEDFTRRLLYRYDWIQPKVNTKGQVVSIENKKELKETWQELKSRVQNDYTGEIVEYHLEKLGLELETDQSVYPAISQYYLFGLLFPAIPQTHERIWERKRLIELSPYEEEQFEEQSVYVKTTEDERMYQIKGSLLPGSQTELETFEGYMIVPVNQTFPVKTEINTSIKKDGIISQWHFKLERY